METGRSVIRVYGDSLSMPRPEEGISPADIYPEKVRRRYEKVWGGGPVEVVNRSKYNATISSVLEDYRSDSAKFGGREERLLIIQVGVCDCAPRPVPLRVRYLIGRFPQRIQSRIIDFLHRNRPRIQRVGFWRNTSPKLFSARFQTLLADAVTRFERICVINIPPTNDAIEAQSPGFSASIVKYNDLIRKTVESVPSDKVRLIDVFTAITNHPAGIDTYVIRKDGHHITHAGHDLYATLIGTQEQRFSKAASL